MLVLRSHGEAAAKERAAGTLACLADAGRRKEVAAADGVQQLVVLLQGGSARGKRQAARAMANLAEDTGLHAALAGAGLAHIVSLAKGVEGEARDFASSLLHKLATGGDEGAQAAVASSEAAVGLLVSQLGGSLAEQQAAAGSLRHMARFAEARQAIVWRRGVAALVATAQVKGLDAHGRRDACMALAQLSCAPHGEAVAAAGGAEVLIEAVRRDGGGEVAQAAAAALEELVACEAGRRAVLAGGVGPCVQLLQSSQEAVQRHALSILEHVAAGADGQAAIGEADAMPCLVALCGKGGMAEDAARLLDRLAFDAPRCQAAVDAGAVLALSALLSTSHLDTRSHTLAALTRICCLVPGASLPPDAIGPVSELCGSHQDVQTREDSAALLAVLASSAGNALPILRSGGARSLAQLLHDDDGSETARERAATALDALAPALCGGYHERLLHADSSGAARSVLESPLCWSEPMLRFLAPATQATYPNLMATAADFYFELYHLCVVIQLRQAAAHPNGVDDGGEEAARRVLEVFEIFENEPSSLRFIAGIFPTVPLTVTVTPAPTPTPTLALTPTPTPTPTRWPRAAARASMTSTTSRSPTCPTSPTWATRCSTA